MLNNFIIFIIKNIFYYKIIYEFIVNLFPSCIFYITHLLIIKYNKILKNYFKNKQSFEIYINKIDKPIVITI